MPDITKIKIGNERERSYKDFPANREFKKRAEDENSGSSSDPILENAKETGGIGWTEQIEDTTISWDGDTEGREILMPDMPCYKVADNGVPTSLLIGSTVIYDGQEIVVTQDMLIEPMDGVVMIGEGYVFSLIDTIEYEGTTLNKGIYFNKEGMKYTSSLTYSGEYIHKIKNKFIPKINTMVEVSSDNTYDEVLEILQSGYMPYMQCNINWNYARLYVSSVGRNRVHFGSPPFETDIGSRSYYTYVSEDGWGDIVPTESVHISNAPHNDGVYILTCTITNGESRYTWEDAT